MIVNPKLPSPRNEAEFLKFIEDIDSDLKKNNMLIFQRPIHAIREACLRLGVSLNVVPHGKAIQGIYHGDSLVAHIQDWYQKQYGDRLKINFSPGSAAILIKGDPWKIDFPLIYGKIKFVFDPDLAKYEKLPDTAVNETLYANAFRSIKGFTPELAKSLTREEILRIKNIYMFSLYAIQYLFEIKSKPFIPEARSDLEAAVNNLFITHPHYGQSKWSSLQFAEKMFKCFLKTKNVSFMKNHNLLELSKLARQNGMPIIPDEIISVIQCPAGARYGEISVSMMDAIKAHHGSLIVCATVVNEFRNYIGGLEKRKKSSASALGINEGNFYFVTSLNFFYYCDKIEADTVHWILIESYQHGNLLQVEFTQLPKDANNYILVVDQDDLIRLMMLLYEYNQNRKLQE